MANLALGDMTDPMTDPEYLRTLAARMLAVALTVRDPDLLRKLAVRATEYLDQATALELEQAAVTHPPKPELEPA